MSFRALFESVTLTLNSGGFKDAPMEIPSFLKIMAEEILDLADAWNSLTPLPSKIRFKFLSCIPPP